MGKIDYSYVLWLPSWYPSKLEPYSGDFIQRHARAASLYSKIRLIHVVRDTTGAITSNYKTEIFENKSLHETIVYYYVSPSKLKGIEKLRSFLKYRRLCKKTIKETFLKNGEPYLVQVCVAFRAGLLALWIKKRFQIPYVVSEHWTIFLPEAKPHFSELPFYLRISCKKLIKEASSVTVVSNYLGKCLKQLFGIKNLILIPNVVDNSIFYLKDLSDLENTKQKKVRFIHISTLEYQKNPEDIFLALSLVRKRGYEFVLDVVGPPKQNLVHLLNQLQLNNALVFHAEMSQQELAVLMRRANALILYSRYETFGCVLIEAYACGLPVIVSDIEVMHENVFDFTGVFAQKDSFDALSEKIISFIENENSFDKKKIADFAIDKYNYERIGLQFYNWYKELVN